MVNNSHRTHESANAALKIQTKLEAAFERNGIYGKSLDSLKSGNFYLKDANHRLITKEAWVFISQGETLELVLRSPHRLQAPVAEIQTAGTSRPLILLGGDSLVQYGERYPQGIGPYLRKGDLFRLLLTKLTNAQPFNMTLKS